LALTVAAALRVSEVARRQLEQSDDVSRPFEEVARVLEGLDIDRAWAAATEPEGRILVEELGEHVTFSPII
jgi:hypothetical protein